MEERYLVETILEDLSEKMVFIGGPRQVGKTTMAEYISENYFSDPQYLNWDDRQDRKNIMECRFKADADLLVFDEIHKYKNWKNHIKGIYDKNKHRLKIIVTGSARLDIYRKGGDSLMGRYHYYRLHPFSAAEYTGKENEVKPFKELKFPRTTAAEQDAHELLKKFGGFPEPFLNRKEKTLRRWHNQRAERLVKEDIRDIQNIREISSLQLMVDILPERAGSLLSLNSLSKDLLVSHKTASHWMETLERFYYSFRIYPFHHSKIRSLRKEPKLYLWDWSEVRNPAAASENMAASHLLKLCHFLKDSQGRKTELNYIRDLEGRETDFIVSENGKPWFAVEVKTSAAKPSKQLLYFSEKMKIPFPFQVVEEKNIDVFDGRVRTISMDKFLPGLV